MKKLRILRLLSIFTIAAAGVFGAVNFKSTKSKQETETVSVNAESWTQNPTIYFMPHNQWIQNGNERFKMNFYDNGTFKGDVEMTYLGISTVKGPFYNRKCYKGTVTNGSYVSRIQICRMDSNYSSQYNYSGQIYLTNDNASPVLVCDSGLDYWNNFTTDTSGVRFIDYHTHAIYKTSDQTPSTSTGRVFFYNSGTHWASAAGCAVYAWGGSASSQKIWSSQSVTVDATIYHLTWFSDDNGEMYGYADIPTNVTGYKFTTINSGVDSYELKLGYFSDTQFSPDSFAYIRYGLQNGNSINSGGAKNDVAGANLMKKVIQAYNTCSNSVLNGYGAYSALNTNLYSHATAAALSATEKSLGGNSATIQAHFEGMMQRSLYGSSSSHNLLFFKNAEKAPTYAVIILISTIGLATIGGYFFYQKRKENN